MANYDPATAKIDGYTSGKEGKPSNPPNDHGFLYTRNQKEVEADKAYREGYKQGEKDRKRGR